MEFIPQSNIFFKNFLTNYNKQVLDYNKKHKEDKLPELTESSLNELGSVLKNVIKFNILFKNKELHANLVLLIHLIRCYGLNEKLHPKEVKNVNDLIVYIRHQNNLIELKHKADFLKGMLRYPQRTILNFSEFAAHRIHEYGNLLMSKAIDYLPETEESKEIIDVADTINVYKNYLQTFVDVGAHYLVYPFTEHHSYIPFNLKLLNGYNKLGDNIQQWIEEFDEHPVSVLLNEKGFDCVYRWGDYHKQKTPVNKTVAVRKNDNVEKTVKLSKQVIDDLGFAVYKHIQMYIHCDKFTLRNSKHCTLLARTIAYVVHHYSNGHMVSYGTLKVVFDQVRSFLNKKIKSVSVPKFQTRKDKKLWMIPEFIPHVLEMLRIMTDSRVQLFVSETIAHAFDVCIPSGEDFKEVVAAHKDYIVRSHNRVYNTEDKWTNKEIEDALKLYQYVLLPEYKELTEPETHWMFLSTLGLWLNVGDEVIVEDIYNKLKDYFEKRHTAEENEIVVNRDLQYVKMMSYKNKASLLKRLTDNPIELVSYAGSKEIYNDMITILEKDVYRPDMTFSDKKINITENGIVVS